MASLVPRLLQPGIGNSTVSKYKAREYLNWAAECLRIARNSDRDEDKSKWLGMASQWRRLAEQAGNRGQQAQQPQPEEDKL